jgi:hypothetical protein
MLGRKTKTKQSIPWYRKRGYKGNLTEEEKRELDSYRWLAQREGGKHPAADYSDLPEEVQMYISKLEIELYDKIQSEPVLGALLLNAIFGFYLLNYFGWIAPKYDSNWLALLSIAMLIVPWIYYAFKFRRNADEFWERSGSEGIMSEWELEHVISKKTKERTH